MTNQFPNPKLGPPMETRCGNALYQNLCHRTKNAAMLGMQTNY